MDIESIRRSVKKSIKEEVLRILCDESIPLNDQPDDGCIHYKYTSPYHCRDSDKVEYVSQ
jgi:hypothetical protein